MNRTIETGRPGGGVSTAGRAAAPTRELIGRAVRQLRRLMRAEFRLARAELAARARRADAAAGLLAGAGLAAGYAAAALLLTLVLLLALVTPAWVAALVVTGVLFALAAVLAAIGRGRLRQVGSIVPEQRVASVKADLRAVSRAAKRRRQ